jgi:hypothetical protein
VWPDRSGACRLRSPPPSRDGEALDLYSRAAQPRRGEKTEQSTLLLLAFAEHLTVLREIESGKAATSVARNDSSES